MPTANEIQRYYDERVHGKLRDFLEFNPRIEAAMKTIADYAPLQPNRILEVGCGIGASTWRMARAWPNAEVVGIDPSAVSIDIANTCFRLPNLRYEQGLVEPGSLSSSFDLVVLMDVYEHVAAAHRQSLHQALAEILTLRGRVILTFPTPEMLAYLKREWPEQIQPVDEDITVEVVQILASDCDARLSLYKKVGIWRNGDYAHAVIDRGDLLSEVKPAEIKERLRVHADFSVSRWRRRKLAAPWINENKSNEAKKGK
jgi:trans-aconitate methyltransferase